MFEAGHIDREDRERRLQALNEKLQALDNRQVMQWLEPPDWDLPPRKLNAILRAMFREITLDPETFQPVAFDWTVPEWRR